MLRSPPGSFKPSHATPLRGFSNPVLVHVIQGGEILDVLVKYPDEFVQPMLFHASEYFFLPTVNCAARS